MLLSTKILSWTQISLFVEVMMFLHAALSCTPAEAEAAPRHNIGVSHLIHAFGLLARPLLSPRADSPS